MATASPCFGQTHLIRLSFEESGVYVRLNKAVVEMLDFTPSGHHRRLYETARIELESARLDNPDWQVLEQLIRGASRKMRLAPPQPPCQNAQAVFSLAENRLLLDFTPHTGKGAPMTLNTLRTQAREACPGDWYQALNTLEEVVANRQPVKSLAVAWTLDARAHLLVNRDKGTAHASIESARGGQPVSREQLVTLLAQQGVTHGLLAESLDLLAQLQGDAGELLVARATPCENGQDGWLEWLFSCELAETPDTPESADAAGRVNHRQRGQEVPRIKAGKTIALLHPPVPGKAGVGLRGETLEPPPVSALHIVAGEEVQSLTQGDLVFFTALADGQPVLMDGVLSLAPVLQVNGDVDYATGDIQFPGTVMVARDVLPGFRVNAGRDVVVNGQVDAAHLQAQGDLHLHGGVHGHGKALLDAQGAVQVKFVNHATVLCLKDLVVDDEMLHCQAYVGENLEALRGKGRVAGGRVVAGGTLRVNRLGAPHTRTIVEMLPAPQAQRQLRTLRDTLYTFYATYAWARPAAQLFRKHSPESPETFLQELEKQPYGPPPPIGRNPENVTRLLSLLMEIDALRERIKVAEEGFLPRVEAKEVFPGTTITLGVETFMVQHHRQDMKVSLVAGQLYFA